MATINNKILPLDDGPGNVKQLPVNVIPDDWQSWGNVQSQPAPVTAPSPIPVAVPVVLTPVQTPTTSVTVQPPPVQLPSVSIAGNQQTQPKIAVSVPAQQNSSMPLL